MKQPSQGKITLKEIALFGVYGALLVALKEVMSFLPNIEPVSIMLIAFTCVYGYKAIFPATVFAIVEIFLYGFHIWNFMYLYVWAVLVGIALIFIPLHNLLIKKKPIFPVLMWSVLSALYGLIFGSLCSIPYFITMGTSAGIAFIVSGFGFDIIHCVSNFVIALLLFYPIYTVLIKCRKILDT